jgi:hypothetical protein
VHEAISLRGVWLIFKHLFCFKSLWLVFPRSFPSLSSVSFPAPSAIRAYPNAHTMRARPAPCAAIGLILLITFVFFQQQRVLVPAGDAPSKASAEGEQLPPPLGDFVFRFDSLSCLGPYTHITNPSLLRIPGSSGGMLLAARRLRVDEKKKGFAANTWHSDIVFAYAPSLTSLLDPSSVFTCTTLGMFSESSAWRNETCQYSFWSGNTHALGPEDPKLFIVNHQPFLMFGSRPRGRPSDCEDLENQKIVFAQHMAPLLVARQMESPLKIVSRDTDANAPALTEYLHRAPRLQFTSDPIMLSWQPSARAGGRELQKNFAAFTTKDGHVHMAYSLRPHMVLRLDPQSGLVSQTFTSDSKVLHAGPFADVQIRGNTPAVLADCDALFGASCTRDHHSLFLAVMHIQRPHGHYRHFLYTFAPTAPFEILSASCELPLHTQPRFHLPAMMPSVAYVSSLTLAANATLVIAYGSGDKEARASVLSLRSNRVRAFPHQSHMPCPEVDR